jgi:hypothetical protein
MCAPILKNPDQALGGGNLMRRLPKQLGGPVMALLKESASVEGATPTWPQDKLSALRLGRRLVAEVPAAPGRRAFVDITPILDQRDDLAEREGWQRPDSRRFFQLAHWDFNERHLDSWDYDVDARQIRANTVTDESSLLRLVAEWGLTPAQFGYPWDTDDPR